MARSAWSADAHGPTVYRWVDRQGTVHYGDQVPPRYSGDASTILNSEGIAIGQRAAQLTPAQLEAAQRRRKKLQQQKQRDNFLLTTYASVGDIERLRDERIDQLNAQRAAAQQYIANLRERLLALQKRAMHFRPYSAERAAHRMPDDLAADLVRTLNEVQTQRDVLAAKNQEEATMRAQFQADIQRYRELRSPHKRSDPQTAQ